MEVLDPGQQDSIEIYCDDPRHPKGREVEIGHFVRWATGQWAARQDRAFERPGFKWQRPDEENTSPEPPPTVVRVVVDGHDQTTLRCTLCPRALRLSERRLNDTAERLRIQGQPRVSLTELAG